MTIDKQVNGNDLTLKASYQYVGDVFTLQARCRCCCGAGPGRWWVAPLMAVRRGLFQGEALTVWSWGGCSTGSVRACWLPGCHVAPDRPPACLPACLPQETWKFNKQNKLVGT